LLAAILLGGQVVIHLLSGKINRRNTLEQMAVVGPESLIIASDGYFVGMVFTIQVARLSTLVPELGGVLALALTRNSRQFSQVWCWRGESARHLQQNWDNAGDRAD